MMQDDVCDDSRTCFDVKCYCFVRNHRRNDHDWNVAEFTCACLHAAERSI